MDDKEREVYWETLCSLDGNNLIKDADHLNKVIKYPSHIYRYRPLNLRTIEAFSKNKLYFSTANYYDDPFDTFININLSEIDRLFDNSELFCGENIKNMIKVFSREFLNCDIDENVLQMIITNLMIRANDTVFKHNIQNYIRNIRNEVKKEIYSACFSEEKYNENLWLKYADQYRGFVIEYDLSRNENYVCGKKDKCNKCLIKTTSLLLYPIYYAKTKYDASKLGQFLAICNMIQDTLTDEKINRLISMMGTELQWEKTKIATIKKECHKYDREWRMILPIISNQPVAIEWIPSAIYLGLRMEKSEMELLMNIAKIAGVEKVYRCYINDNGEIDSKLLKTTN